MLLIFSDLWTYLQLAQPARLLLEYTGTEYEDKFYRCGEGKAMKEMNENPSDTSFIRLWVLVKIILKKPAEVRGLVCVCESHLVCLQHNCCSLNAQACLQYVTPFFPSQRQTMTRAAGLTKNLHLEWNSPT